MVEAAAWAGADAIKLQTVDPDENYVKGHPSWELFRTCRLSRAETSEMFELSRSLGMEPFTTSPDPCTLQWVDALGVPGHKISSGMMTNDVILRKTCATGKPVLISTGMATTEQIDHAVAVAKGTGNQKLALFQCTSEYPAAASNLNLATLDWLGKRYGLTVGFSDHSEGVEAAIAATAMGATMVEKHFSLNRTQPGYDHRISLEPEAFKSMVEGIRRAQAGGLSYAKERVPELDAMIGRPERILSESLKASAAGNLRCLVARRPISAGETFTEDNIGIKRPFADKRGLEPSAYDRVAGKVAKVALEVDDPIKSNCIVNEE